jgi:predicted permease
MMRGLVALIPADMMEFLPFLQDPALSPRVLMYVCGIGVLATILFAVIPIVRLSIGAMHHRAAEGDRGSSGRTWHRLASKLVVIELAVAVVLVSGAGLLTSSVRQLLAVELSFNPDQLMSLTVIGSGPKYEGEAARRAFGREVLSRIGAVPGVTATGLTSVLPVSFNGNTDWIRFVGRPYNGEHNEVNLRVVSDRYFITLEAPLVKGRYFSGIDDESHPRVVIINEALARRYFPGEDPVGQHIGDTSLTPSSIKEIVGVVADIREGALDAEIWPAVYYPFDQFPASGFAVLARTSRSDGSVGRAIEAAVRAMGSAVAAIDVISLRDRIDNSPAVYLHRSATWLVTGFGAVAWLLGTVGLYGVLAYAVGHRTREIGIRLALGATRSSVSGLVVREASTLALLGILVGLACAVAVATFMRDLLFGTAPWDAPTLASVAAGLAVSALLACYLPARRAAAVDPVRALRAD